MNNIVEHKPFGFETENEGKDVRKSDNNNVGLVVNESTLGDSFVQKCKKTNYISFENYSRFGTFKPGVSVGWKQGWFYGALKELGILCKVNRRWLPCDVAEDTTNKYKIENFNVGTVLERNNEGKVTKRDVPWFKKGDSGHWGFRTDKLSEFLNKYHKQIQEYADQKEAEAKEELELKEYTRMISKRYNIAQKDVNRFLLTQMMENLTREENEANKEEK